MRDVVPTQLILQQGDRLLDLAYHVSSLDEGGVCAAPGRHVCQRLQTNHWNLRERREQIHRNHPCGHLDF